MKIVLHLGIFLIVVLVACCAGRSLCSRVQAQSQGQMPAQEQQRPANFVFLIDVSGSMLSKKTMVTASDGTQVTLFESLRQALKQIVEDPRLIGPGSKVAFVTFGTAITEKSSWPSRLDTPADRQKLSESILSSTQLQADKHGDTYMAGALDKAYAKAIDFGEHSEPCTTTFIVMLTDGWDEPPAGSTLRVRDVAARVVSKERDLKKRLGVNTWQVKVVGLQRLPDKKAGTTTASELAAILGGDFFDVSKQGNGTIADRIYQAMKKTIDDLQGRMDVAPVSAGGFLDFGTIKGGDDAKGTIDVSSRSCYGEKLTSVAEVSNKLSSAELRALHAEFDQVRAANKLKDSAAYDKVALVSTLPPNAISCSLDKEVPLVPTIDQAASQSTTAMWQPVPVRSHVGALCPPGAYLGALRMIGTARCDKIVPFAINVPSRIVTDTGAIKAQIRKPGFLWNEPTKTKLQFAVGTSVAGQQEMPEEVVVEPAGGKATSGALLDRSLINGGRSLNVKLNMARTENAPVLLDVDIPADLAPGKYDGQLAMRVNGRSSVLAPTSIAWTIEILPSPWEQVRPIAIPILFLAIIVMVVWFGMWLSALKRS